MENLYGATKGPYQVISHHDIKIEDVTREVELSVYYPDTETATPLILFSHGNFSDRQQYDRLINHWVSHGYSVIAPDHLDSGGMVNGIIAMTIHGQFGVLKERPQDIIFALDNLNLIEQQIPGFINRLNLKNIIAAGHSFGAFVAQMFGGAKVINPDTNEIYYHKDDRIKAIVAISPPGPMFDMITERSWDELSKPQIVTTGTWDVEPRFFPEWQLHAMSYHKATKNDNYLLVTKGADHYLGNLICRLDREEEPQWDALNMVLSSTTAFMDAYIKTNSGAKQHINSGSLQDLTKNFSTLTTR